MALAQAGGSGFTLIPNDELYLASPGTMLSIVGRQNDNVTTVVLVGHNPGLTQLVNSLLPDLDLDNLPTAGVVAMQFQCESWANIVAARATLEFYDYPKRRGTG